ncbi:Murein DD-endopeptidase MepM and murein hydrolase activator NlpD, contain LysM domain [Ruaniaceae bacterium KH17]|nr:Murein DD-endopeptidase MepM and murein hydrolase activator NlpD, contain LysM domain [Ruaniaceae bacterium KH17]
MTEVSERQLTRRQLRDLRNSGADVSAAPADYILSVAETETLPIPTRRSMREHTAAKAAPKRTSSAPRAAVLTSLGIATIAAPLTGFVSPEQSAQAIAAPIVTSVPLAQSISALAAESRLEGAVPSSSALTANPNASAIAVDLSARSQTRTLSECAVTESGASGVREASIERVSATYMPVAAGAYSVTSHFGARWGSIHSGTDFAAAAYTPIHAVADGEVVLHSVNGTEGRSGNLLVVKSEVNGQTVWFWYGHMYDNGVYVKQGDTVKAGQVIAGIGSKGYSTGPHLHLEIHVGTWDNAVNPYTWLTQNGAVSPGSC